MTYNKAILEFAFFEVEDVIMTSNVVDQVPPNPPVVILPSAEIPSAPPAPPEDDSIVGEITS